MSPTIPEGIDRKIAEIVLKKVFVTGFQRVEPLDQMSKFNNGRALLVLITDIACRKRRFDILAVSASIMCVVSWVTLMLTAKFWWPLLGVHINP